MIVFHRGIQSRMMTSVAPRRHGVCVVVAMMLIACNPSSVRLQNDSTGASTGSTTIESSTTADPSATTGTSVDDTSTGAALDCEAETPGCPEGCKNVSAHVATWDDPHVGPGEDLCIAE